MNVVRNVELFTSLFIVESHLNHSNAIDDRRIYENRRGNICGGANHKHRKPILC